MAQPSQGVMEVMFGSFWEAGVEIPEATVANKQTSQRRGQGRGALLALLSY